LGFCFVFCAVLYCTLLASAQTESEKGAVKERMRSEPALSKILNRIETGEAEDRVDSSGKASSSTRGDVGKSSNVPEGGGATGGGVAGARKLVDLELMAETFKDGSHFMSNDKCSLPDGSFRKQRKGYEEVHVPALKPKPFGVDEALVGIDKLPNYVQPAFDGFKSLNRIQSRIHKVALESDQNLLICAPTVNSPN
jgi:pre-mRNA-splicing helicase BRR2